MMGEVGEVEDKVELFPGSKSVDEMEEIEEKVELFPGSKSVPVGDSTLEVHELFSEFDWSISIEPLCIFGQALNWCCCISSTESNSVLQPEQQDSETILSDSHHRSHRRKASSVLSGLNAFLRNRESIEKLSQFHRYSPTHQYSCEEIHTKS